VRGACKYQSSAVVAKVNNIYQINALDSALASGPVPVYVQVTNSFRQYGSGIFNGVCGSAINHAVTAVGYGVENGKTYFIIRNSWGTGWGEAGYIRILANGNCGVYKNVYPTVN
jgi:C1A family cysteine protease